MIIVRDSWGRYLSLPDALAQSDPVVFDVPDETWQEYQQLVSDEEAANTLRSERREALWARSQQLFGTDGVIKLHVAVRKVVDDPGQGHEVSVKRRWFRRRAA